MAGDHVSRVTRSLALETYAILAMRSTPSIEKLVHLRSLLNDVPPPPRRIVHSAEDDVIRDANDARVVKRAVSNLDRLYDDVERVTKMDEANHNALSFTSALLAINQLTDMASRANVAQAIDREIEFRKPARFIVATPVLLDNLATTLLTFAKEADYRRGITEKDLSLAFARSSVDAEYKEKEIALKHAKSMLADLQAAKSGRR